MKHFSTKSTKAVAAVGALLLPFLVLIVVYLLIAALTTRTESAERTIGFSGYLGFAATSVIICGLVAVAGNALSRRTDVVLGGLVVGWSVFVVSVALLITFSLFPALPPWASWRSFRSFMSLLGTPFIYAIAMAIYTVAATERRTKFRRPWVAALSVAPGLVIALFGFLDPLT